MLLKNITVIRYYRIQTEPSSQVKRELSSAQLKETTPVRKTYLPAETSLGCLTFTAQSDVYAEFDTRRLLSHSSAEGRKFLGAHHKSEFKTCITIFFFCEFGS